MVGFAGFYWPTATFTHLCFICGCLVLQRQFSYAETTGSENVKYLLSGLSWEKFVKAHVKPLIRCLLVVGAPCPWSLSSPTPSSLSVSLMQQSCEALFWKGEEEEALLEHPAQCHTGPAFGCGMTCAKKTLELANFLLHQMIFSIHLNLPGKYVRSLFSGPP